MKKILVVCSKNQWRSPTAEAIYRSDSRLEIRSAGTSSKAKHTISQKDIDWADLILCMETKHAEIVIKRFGVTNIPPITVANIPDDYQFMDPELIKTMTDEIENLLTLTALHNTNSQ